VIKDFDAKKVVIEGHADAVGTQAVNDKISNDRAQTVRDYFVSNGMIDKEKLQTEGFGDKKPLATNKTQEGRSQNRRVDVVIQVDNTPL